MDDQQKETVNISKEDAKNVKDFFSHFNITFPDYLDNCLKSIESASEITQFHWTDLRVNLARALAENSEHDLLKDELFEEVIPNCQKVWFDQQFKEDFESGES